MFTNSQKNLKAYDWMPDETSTRGLVPVQAHPERKDVPAIANARRTRYGVLPIWPHQTSPRIFGVWEIPANQIFPFRRFQNEVCTDLKGNVLYEVHRDTDAQLIDMNTHVPFFVELAELADMEDEDAANRIAEVIHLPNQCKMYADKIGYNCTTCWLTYLEKDLPEAIDLKLKADEKGIAYKVGQKIIAGLQTALAKCRAHVDAALHDIDDLKTSKSTLNEYDLNCVYHLHQNVPQFRTTFDKETAFANSFDQAISRLADVLSPDSLRQDKPKDVSTLKAELAAIQQKLDEAEKAENRTSGFVELFGKPELTEEEKRQKNLDDLAKARASKKKNTESAEV